MSNEGCQAEGHFIQQPEPKPTNEQANKSCTLKARPKMDTIFGPRVGSCGELNRPRRGSDSATQQRGTQQSRSEVAALRVFPELVGWFPLPDCPSSQDHRIGLACFCYDL